LLGAFLELPRLECFYIGWHEIPSRQDESSVTVQFDRHNRMQWNADSHGKSSGRGSTRFEVKLQASSTASDQPRNEVGMTATPEFAHLPRIPID
jgi:hypothetical protein